MKYDENDLQEPLKLDAKLEKKERVFCFFFLFFPKEGGHTKEERKIGQLTFQRVGGGRDLFICQ